MTKEELTRKLIDIGGHCSVCELSKIVDWLIKNKEQIPEEE